MSTEYLIKEETLKATADKIRLYTSPVGDATHVFSWGTTQLPQDGVTKYYYETFDTELADASIGTSMVPDFFYSAGYAENDQGDTVPVLYESNGDAYYYVGQAEIGGQILDKWRKIEVVYEDEQQTEKWSTWDSDYRAYAYTECIVTVAEDFDVSIDPVDFPDKITDVYNAGLANGESELPTLTAPASNAEVLTGKEYIDANGQLQVGTLPKSDYWATSFTATPSFPTAYLSNGEVSGYQYNTLTFSAQPFTVPTIASTNRLSHTYYWGGWLTYSKIHVYNEAYLSIPNVTMIVQQLTNNGLDTKEFPNAIFTANNIGSTSNYWVGLTAGTIVILKYNLPDSYMDVEITNSIHWTKLAESERLCVLKFNGNASIESVPTDGLKITFYK